MAFTAIDLIIGAAVGFGVSEIAQGASKAPKSPDQPTLPNTETAQKDAATTTNNQRHTLLAAGGQTDYTGGLGVLTGSDVSKSTLIGS